MKSSWLLAAALGVMPATWGCAGPEPAIPTGEGAGPLTARGVTVRLPLEHGELVALADELTFESGAGPLILAGDASVTIDGETPFEARADRIAIDVRTGQALLDGRVQARLVPAAPVGEEGTHDGGR